MIKKSKHSPQATHQNQKMKDMAKEESAVEQPEDLGADAIEQPVDPEQAPSPHDGCYENIALLEARLEEANNKFLRLFSEFDNFRKRTSKERIELTKTATSDIITAMLPVLDDLERAAQLSVVDNGSEATKEGIVLILNKLKSILRQKGVEEITALGEPFDTDFHEAVTHVPAEDEGSKGKVIDELQKGYLLNGKVIRFSRVVVAG